MNRQLRNLFIVLLLLAGLPLTACGQAQAQSFKIGIANVSSQLDETTIAGFKASLAENGYVENENVTYIYNGAIENMADLEPEINKLTAANVDLILALTTEVAAMAQHVAGDTGTPVVFAVVTDPVAAGLVESLVQPGGNMTGVRNGDHIRKSLEALLTVAPETANIYVPHNPNAAGSVQGLALISDAAAGLGVELTVREVHDNEEVTAALASIPDEAEAIFLLPDSLVLNRIDDFIATAHEQGLPLVSISHLHVQWGALMSFGPDITQIGRQAGRLADRVLKGTPPADLPIETAEFYLSLNLQTAQAIDLNISDDVLQQADNIVR